MQSMTYRKGQKVFHIPTKQVVEVVRDEGGVKVVVRVDRAEVSVPRKNLRPLEEEGDERNTDD